jgi:hypothetical protein
MSGVGEHKQGTTGRGKGCGETFPLSLVTRIGIQQQIR